MIAAPVAVPLPALTETVPGHDHPAVETPALLAKPSIRDRHSPAVSSDGIHAEPGVQGWVAIAAQSSDPTRAARRPSALAITLRRRDPGSG